jgi:hypothetical protein
MGNGAGYEDRFVTFVDFLGFSEASQEIDDEKRIEVLKLLRALAGLRSDFVAAPTQQADGHESIYVRPAISTFSDTHFSSLGLNSLSRWQPVL